MANTQQKALDALKKRADGSYEKVKDTEAHAGGRKLPGGLEEEQAAITNAKVDLNKQNKPYFMLYISVKTPDAYMGVNQTIYYGLTETDYMTEQEATGRLVNDMQLLGYDTGMFSETYELIEHVLADVKKRKKIPFLYNTGSRPNDDGEYRLFIADSRNMEDSSEEEAPRKGRRQKAKGNSPFAVGDKVETTGDHYGDGNTYYGVVEEVDGGEISVRFDDDNALDQVPAANLIKSGGGEEETEEGSGEEVLFEEGDAVITTGDFFETGEEYEGTVIAVNDETCTVEFEDETTDVPFENLTAAS